MRTLLILAAMLIATSSIAGAPKPAGPTQATVDSLKAHVARLERDCANRKPAVAPRRVGRRPVTRLARVAVSPAPAPVVNCPPARTILLCGHPRAPETWWQRNGGMVVGAAILGAAVIIAANQHHDAAWATASATSDCGEPCAPPPHKKGCH